MSSEYDLKQSEKGIGQLYPILVAKDGEIIDGFHRDKADKNWKRVKLDHIDTEEKKLQARLVANFHRRIVPYADKKQWINDLAEIYQKQGETSIANKIAEENGIRYDTVLTYLDGKFKDHRPTYANITRDVEPASQRFVTLVGTHRGNVAEAEKLVEEHREEVKQELLKSPEFQREIIKQIEKSPLPKASCPILPPLTPDETIEPMPESPKSTLTATCPKCGFKFEF